MDPTKCPVWNQLQKGVWMGTVISRLGNTGCLMFALLSNCRLFDAAEEHSNSKMTREKKLTANLAAKLAKPSY